LSDKRVSITRLTLFSKYYRL